eukprot:TRINITY_DN10706_c0_g1_i1.p1 TRINITY_DN10706_c0_g1~~TRINITY_DN10706_c0_g1_i1.p1  ORF type:complete len:548 (+),score=105.12 TRINITY_DN10706_c0_g1_i1:85-1644(+)
MDSMTSNGGNETEVSVPVGKNGGLKPLSRKAHEQQLEQILHHIQSREEERMSLLDNLKKIRDRLGETRSRRDLIAETRTAVDDQLTDINKKVFDKREQVQKVRSGMLYQNEELIGDQIQKLEIQLTKNNFKPSEEKKIILEINRLKRSKNLLKEFNILKSELDTLRSRQREIREKRDELFKERGDVKRVEDGLKKESRETKEKVESLKTEIDGMWLEKKELVNEFRALEAKHRQLLFEKREELRQRRKEDKAALEEQKNREFEEMRANSEPFEEQRHLCKNLITYCEKFDNSLLSTPPPQDPTPSPTNLSNSLNLLSVPNGSCSSRRNSNNSRRSSDNESVYSTPIGGLTPVTTPIEDGCFVYKKSQNDEHTFVRSKKSNKNNKKRNSMNKTNKPLTHNPETFGQFLSLNVNPPVTTNEVASTIVELKSKLKHFEEQALLVKNSRKNGSVDLPTFNLVDSTYDSKETETTTESKLERSKKTSESLFLSKDTPIVSEAFPCLPQPAISLSSFASDSVTKA